MRNLPLAVLAAMLATSCGSDVPPDSIGTLAAPIVRGGDIAVNAGANLYGVAIYIGGARPCSGVLLNANGWVLTSKVCIGSTPVSAMRATRAVAPGPTVPADAVPIDFASPHNATNLMLLRAPGLTASTGSWPPGGAFSNPTSAGTGYADAWGTWDGYGTPLYLGPPSTLATTAVAASGYGHSVYPAPDESTAGRARAAALVVTSPIGWPTGTYTLPNATAPDGGLIQATFGDDGGPSFFLNTTPCTGCGPMPWQLVGVHTTVSPPSATTDTSAWVGGQWIQSLTGMTIETLKRASYDGQRRMLDATSWSLGIPAVVRPFSDSLHLNWGYDPALEQVKTTTERCLELQGGVTTDGTPILVQQCTVGLAKQKFRFTKAGQIQYVGSTKCISLASPTANQSNLVIKTCTTTGTDGPNQVFIARAGQFETPSLTSATSNQTRVNNRTWPGLPSWAVLKYTTHGMPMYVLQCKPSGAGPFRTQIVNHGAAGGVGGPANADGTPNVEIDTCMTAASNGWNTFMPAYRGEPVYAPDPDNGTAHPWLSAGHVEVCLGEVDDVLRLTTLVRARTDVKPDKIVMRGNSHGGCITTRAIQRGALVQRAADVSGPTDWGLEHTYCVGTGSPPTPPPACNGWGGIGLAPWLAQRLGGTPATAPIEYDWRSPARYTPDLVARTDVKLLQIHGVSDPLVPLTQGCDARTFSGGTWNYWQLVQPTVSPPPITPTNAFLMNCDKPYLLSTPDFTTAHRQLVVIHGLWHFWPAIPLELANLVYQQFRDAITP